MTAAAEKVQKKPHLAPEVRELMQMLKSLDSRMSNSTNVPSLK